MHIQGTFSAHSGNVQGTYLRQNASVNSQYKLPDVYTSNYLLKPQHVLLVARDTLLEMR
jgi:hypothetical protein